VRAEPATGQKHQKTVAANAKQTTSQVIELKNQRDQARKKAAWLRGQLEALQEQVTALLTRIQPVRRPAGG
jgi:uncharacterized coiled-coil DUF342 family protein